jgi:hypothetical protein
MTSILEPPTPSVRPRQRTFSLNFLMLAILVASVAFAMLFYLGQSILEARRAAAMVNSATPLNQVMLALSSYHDDQGCFPPAYIADKNGKPMHSWRVLILPYLGHQGLYNAYNFNEPWNGPYNSQLAQVMPNEFQSRSETIGTNTAVVVVVGPNTPFPGAKSTKLADFKDGPENCILATEIADSDICWLEPRDLDATTMSFQVNDRSKPSISSVRWRQPYIVFADSIHAYPVPSATPPHVLQALTTIAGGEAVSPDSIKADGYIDE